MWHTNSHTPFLVYDNSFSLGQFLVIFLQMTAGKTCDPGRSVGVDFSSHEFHQSGVSNEHSGKQKCCQITCRRVVSVLLQCLSFIL